MDLKVIDIINFLENWEKSYNQIEMALDLCKKSLNEYAEENGDKIFNGFILKEVVIKLKRQVLSFNHSLIGYPFIETSIGMYIKSQDYQLDGLEQIGYYNLITTLDGKVNDDYFVIEKLNSKNL